MKPSHTVRCTSKIFVLMILLLISPLLSAAQSKKKDNPPPPPPPQQQQQQQQQQAQPQRQQQPQPQPPAQRPDTSKKPDVVRKPDVIQKPDTTGKPDVSRKPDVVRKPDITGKPDVTRKPDVVRKPDIITAPKILSPDVSKKAVEDLNTKRAAMTGVNHNPLPQGQVTVHPNGSRTIDASGGRKFEVRSNGTVSKISLPDGRSATFHRDGTVSSIRSKDGVQIDRSANGTRTIVSERNGQRIVSTGAGQGYLERKYIDRGDRTYVQRTYVVNNTTYVNVYRTYSYRNVTYYTYVPVVYYQPVFYGWVYDPWAAPVYYTWGWYGDPWYGPYGYYFAPYPVYPSAAYWMTDYIIAENLRAAYEAGEADANARNEGDNQPQGQSNSVTLSPQVKNMIAEEVKAQLAAEREAAAQSANPTPTSTPASGGNADQLPPALDPNLRVFIVTAAMDVTAEGQGCSLSPGDVLMRTDTVADSQNTVPVSVLSSKKADCATGAATRVQVADLQEMHNHFREKMDSGLKTLADKQGKAGLPSAPSVRTVAGEVPAPDSRDSEYAVKKVKGQQLEADQAERDIQQQAFTEKTS